MQGFTGSRITSYSLVGDGRAAMAICTNTNQGVTKENGYAKATSILDNNFSRYYDRDIDYETMLDFYNLLVYTEKYVAENSFFNKEAKNLKDTITYLGRQLQDSNDDKIQLTNTEILDEFINSSEVYEDYQKVYARLKNYNSRLKLILLYRTR